MQCPKCSAGLNRQTIHITPEYGGTALETKHIAEDLELDQCLSCNGVWFDANELEEYLAEKLVLIDSPAMAETTTYQLSSGLCPKCQKPMHKDAFRGVMADFCSACKGVWLDGGLLPRLVQKNFSLHEWFSVVIHKFRERSEEP